MSLEIVTCYASNHFHKRSPVPRTNQLISISLPAEERASGDQLMTGAERECRACAVVVMRASHLRSDNGRYQQSADEEDSFTQPVITCAKTTEWFSICFFYRCCLLNPQLHYEGITSSCGCTGVIYCTFLLLSG